MVTRLVELLTARLREVAQNVEAQALARQSTVGSRRTVAPVLLGPGEGLQHEASGEPRPVAPERAPVLRSEPVDQVLDRARSRRGRLRDRLRDPASVRDAYLLKELLDPPLAARRRRH